jgi:hypothetical protein
MSVLGISSCNDLLDLEPISQITPDSYYTSADQVASYLNNYYDSYLYAPYSGYMAHGSWSWNAGKAESDNNTDIFLKGTGSTSWFADDHWEVSSGKVLQDYYYGVRVYNYIISIINERVASNAISGSTEDINNYLGEAHFFRAMVYFRMMAQYGDLPVVTTVLEDDDDAIVEASKRTPRNEVARFILSDLDTAINLLYPRSQYSGQRVNRECALLFKSRVALFEGTFEKYHKGSGRVPGDANWPGASMSYNQGKTFDIDSDIKFFLQEAMEAAKEVGDNANLTTNSGVIQPEVDGATEGWNPYFEMFSQLSLADCPEVLLWKQYDGAYNILHAAPVYLSTGANNGLLKPWADSYLMQNGLPIYAEGSGYHGDATLDNVKKDRDLRLQLFVWGEHEYVYTDVDAPNHNLYIADTVTDAAHIINSNNEQRCITGYQIRKYYTYDYSQTVGMNAYNACPVFRTSEALLNYMEACYELNGTIDATASTYWKQLRARAGVSEDYQATIDATDLSQEQDFGVYSGTTMVDKTLYNIRRERMNELFAEGLRFADLIRWRAFDNMITTKWLPKGCNFWDEMYKHYANSGMIANGEQNANMSMESDSKYVLPTRFSTLASNELRDGYKWHEAYYLYPLGINDLQTASYDRSVENSNLYQNINWPTSAGGHALK